MAMVRRRRPIAALVAALFTLVIGLSESLFAEGRSAEIPENATASRFGGWWTCDRGHRELHGACVAVELPANAFHTDASYGRGWECHRG